MSVDCSIPKFFVLCSKLCSLIVPGKGCGVTIPFKKLDPKVDVENMDDVEQLECNTTPSQDVVDRAVAKITEVKCKTTDVDSCMHSKGKHINVRLSMNQCCVEKLTIP